MGDDLENLVPVTGSAIVAPEVDSDREERTSSLRHRILQLRDSLSQNYFEIGCLLYEVNKHHYYRQWHGPDGNRYESFAEYLEGEVSFKPRKAKYLMNIWWWFGEPQLNDPEIYERVKQIGWTKAASLVGVVDRSNADEWLEKAAKLSIDKLRHETRLALEKKSGSSDPRRPHMHSAKNNTPRSEEEKAPATEVTGIHQRPKSVTDTHGESVTTSDPLRVVEGARPISDEENRDFKRRWTVYIDGDQEKNVEEAIERAREIAEVELSGKGEMLDYIATAFLSTYSGSTGKDHKQHMANFRHQVLESLERNFGLSIVATDPETGELLYGGDR